MKISVIIGGGVGDMILSTRFLLAVREKYPYAAISVFCNDKGITSHSKFVKKHWPFMFNEFHSIEMIDPNFKIVSQYGEEVYNEAYKNIKPEIRARIEEADKVYCFRPDSLDYLEYRDIPWTKYLRCIPSPINIQEPPALQEDFVVVNLYAREGHFSAITKERSDSIISELKKTNNVVILSPSDEVKKTFYKGFENDVIVADLDLCLSIISESRVGVSIDTGIRCLFHAFGKSCYTLCGMCSQFFGPPHSHWLRWYPWTENMLPLNASVQSIYSLVENSKHGISCELFPTVDPKHMDQVLIIRRYD